MDSSATAILAFRGPGETYSSHRSVEQNLNFVQPGQDLHFDIDLESTSIEAIRIHFLGNRKGTPVAFLKLYGVQITARGGQGETDEILININNDHELKQHATIRGMQLNEALLGELYAIDDDDPYIELQFTNAVQPGTPARLVVDVAAEYLLSTDYILTRDLFLAEQDRLSEKLRSVENQLAAVQQINVEFDTYRRSPLWRTFVRLHGLYMQFLQFKSGGVLRTCLKLVQPNWWARRRQTDYEKWRAANGYQSRNKS